jgi:hypothetical protein
MQSGHAMSMSCLQGLAGGVCWAGWAVGGRPSPGAFQGLVLYGVQLVVAGPRTCSRLQETPHMVAVLAITFTDAWYPALCEPGPAVRTCMQECGGSLLRCVVHRASHLQPTLTRTAGVFAGRVHCSAVAEPWVVPAVSLTG